MAEWTTNEEITKDKLNDRRGFKNYLRAYLSAANQKVPTSPARWTNVRFDVESYDNNSEFDVSEKSGTADATEALKLHDADGGFAAGDVGKIVYNTTDDTYAEITAFVDSGELTLDSDIMVNGENYIIYLPKFTVKNAGLYEICSTVYFSGFVDQTLARLGIFKNDGANPISDFSLRASGTGAMSLSIHDIVDLSVNDYIEIRIYQNSGANRTIDNGSSETFLTIRRVI